MYVCVCVCVCVCGCVFNHQLEQNTTEHAKSHLAQTEMGARTLAGGILGDSEKRKAYDETGRTDDAELTGQGLCGAGGRVQVHYVRTFTHRAAHTPRRSCSLRRSTAQRFCS